MKKNIFRFGVLAILFILSISLASCENEEIPEDNINHIIQDEATWNEAFDKLEYDNFSMKLDSSDTEAYTWVCETGRYMKWKSEFELGESYTQKTEEGNCRDFNSSIKIVGDSFLIGNETYSTLDEALKHRKWLKRERTQEEYNLENYSLILRISFSDKLEFFVYNEETKCYSYDGRMIAKVYSPYADDYDDIYCINPSIQFENGKIVSLSTEYAFAETDETYGKVTYFNLGTTTVSIPEEVISGAK
ncbi:MAG: hypothetical protein K2K15_00335 [Anaeroplasmataceae bacterium]|nr:hypothetical protein [Anaeroplasmataceae bacterium]